MTHVPHNIALVRHTTLKHRASHGLDDGEVQHTMLNRASHALGVVRHSMTDEAVAIPHRNITFVRYTTLKHRASHALGRRARHLALGGRLG